MIVRAACQSAFIRKAEKRLFGNRRSLGGAATACERCQPSGFSINIPFGSARNAPGQNATKWTATKPPMWLFFAEPQQLRASFLLGGDHRG
jgi:hypothetical protein